MLTSCTHCGTMFKVPDKTIGKKARCKSCGKGFVLTPVDESVELDEVVAGEASSAAQAPAAPAPSPAASDDPLDALADASSGSTSSVSPARIQAPAPVTRSPQAAERSDDAGYRAPQRMANGAKAALVTAIIAAVFATAGLTLGIIAIVKADDQTLLIRLGITAIVLLALGAVCAMIAVVNGTNAMRKIRRARHPLGGKSQASTGTLVGWIAMGLILVATVIGGIWLARRGGITFQQEITITE